MMREKFYKSSWGKPIKFSQPLITGKNPPGQRGKKRLISPRRELPEPLKPGILSSRNSTSMEEEAVVTSRHRLRQTREEPMTDPEFEPRRQELLVEDMIVILRNIRHL